MKACENFIEKHLDRVLLNNYSQNNFNSKNISVFGIKDEIKLIAHLYIVLVFLGQDDDDGI